jgi:phosphogluconate dehydratase
LTGNLGRAVIKTSAMKAEHHVVEAPAVVFDDQEAVIAAFKAGALSRDCVVVVRFQGPRANGMPELHQLTPSLGSLQSRGFHVALVTDGRMSGASGSVPAAIHVSPEVVSGGPLGRVRDGDILRLDCHTGVLEARVPDVLWQQRQIPTLDAAKNEFGSGRELFASLRRVAGDAEAGAISLM